jgi:hypothetical protein
MIDLFFILLNFAIIVGLTLYAARRFFLPNLKNKVEQEKSIEKNLHDEHRTLLLTQRQVDESIVTQEADCTSFLNKINQWRSSVLKRKEQEIAQARHLQEETEKRLQRQSQYHMLRAMYKNVTPMVVKTLEADLKSHFSDEQVIHGYLQHVLKGLKK